MYKTIAATILGLLLTNSIFVYLDIEVRNAYGSTNTIRRYLELQNPFCSEEDLENNAASWKKWVRELKLAGVNIVAGSDAYVDLLYFVARRFLFRPNADDFVRFGKGLS